jgi:uncharacterized protein (DUF305 family)
MRAALFALAMALASGPVMAQTPAPAPAPAPAAPPMAGMDHGQHGAAAAPRGRVAPSTRGYRAASAKMHKDMAVAYSGDADRDFAAAMIPHHQGAIDMAKVELQYGKDPALRQLAEAVVAAQEKEIAFMRDWQAKHPK